MELSGDRSSLPKARLWSGNIWMICLANLLVSSSIYMLIPALPVWLVQHFSVSTGVAGAVLAVSGISIFLLGPFFNYLVDKYRRRSVCLWAILIGVALTAGYYVASTLALVVCLRMVQGMMQGVALMAGGSTLAIDLAQSPRRTDANNAFAWFGRLGLSIGPLISLLLMGHLGFDAVVWVACLLGILGAVCVLMLDVPFRAPLCPKICSLDRFWLPNGWLMFVLIVPVAACAGLQLAIIHHYEFYVFLMVGFCLALLALRHIFVEADMRAEFISGLLLWGAGLLVLLFHQEAVAWYAGGLLSGLGIGLSVARLLVLYIQLSRHCERGSANTSYMLAWELGLALGLWGGYALLPERTVVYEYGLGLLIVALLLYIGVVHRWFIKHKVR